MKKRLSVGLHDLVEGFLFSLRAEGKTIGTLKSYGYLLRPLLSYAAKQCWPKNVLLLDTQHVRKFLAWVGTRTQEFEVANNGGRVVRKAKPSTAWPYYRATRRLFN